MENNIDYKRLYELSIIEKEKILTDNQKKQEKINELTEELNSYKIENYSKKNYYQKNKEKIIEKVKEYNKNYVKTPEQIKEYNKRAYEKRKAKKIKSRIIATDKKIKRIPLAKIKYLPQKYENPVAVNIYEDKTAIILWATEPIAIVIKNKEITKGYKNYFELMWKIAKA